MIRSINKYKYLNNKDTNHTNDTNVIIVITVIRDFRVYLSRSPCARRARAGAPRKSFARVTITATPMVTILVTISSQYFVTVYCGALQYSKVLDGILQYSAALCYTLFDRIPLS